MMSVESNEPFTFIPEIECSKTAHNGMFDIKIENIGEVWHHEKYGVRYATVDKYWKFLDFNYKRITTQNTINNNSNINNTWYTKQICIGNVSNKIHIRVPVFLHSYTLIFHIKAKNINTNQWMEASNTCHILIQSYLVRIKYQLNDFINIQPQNKFYSVSGNIIAVLPGYNYKIQYYDGSKEITEILHGSKLNPPLPDLQYTIDTIEKTEMNQIVLLKSHCNENIKYYDALYECLLGQTRSMCDNMYIEDKGLIHYKSMAQFIGKNVYDYLFEAEFNYKIDCNFSNDHGGLYMINLQQWYVRATYEVLKNNYGETIGKTPDLTSGFVCDICHFGIHEYDFLFKCYGVDNNCMNTHDICLNCVSNVIVLNSQLQDLLSGILRNVLISDCIKNIVDYVIGRVVYIKLIPMHIIKDRNNEKKRKIENVVIPPCKRRKLN
eukprot:257292_1